MPDQTNETDDLDIRISRKLRADMGFKDEPGSCQDCGGIGLVPDSYMAEHQNIALWRICPTCKGRKQGGRA